MAEHKVIDFSIGKQYATVTGLSCKVTAVTDDFIKVTYNNETSVKYPKMLFAGVYVALKCGLPFIYSEKVKPIVDTSIEHKLHGPQKKRNIYFRLNDIGETYFEIFSKNYEKEDK